MRVEFKLPDSKHTKDTKYSCDQIITLIKYANHREWNPTGSDIAEEMNLRPAEVRKFIQIIREHATSFFEPGEYLVAGKKGYYITTDKKVIKAFMKKTHLMGISKLKQFNEAEKIMGDVDWETGF